MGDKIATALKKVFDGLAMAAGWMMAAATLLAAVNAILRYGFKVGMPWSEETCTYLCILLTFLVLGWLEAGDEHLKIDIFGAAVKSEAVKTVVNVARGLLTLVLFAILFKSGLATIRSTYATGAVTYVLGIPRFILYTVVAAAYALVILGWIARLALRRGKKL